VIDTVKKVSGKDFKVSLAPRRPGDPAGLVAQNARIRNTLGWEPKLDDLETIVRHALTWEEALRSRNR
jgi:UDP-glucose 4-epimerase